MPLQSGPVQSPAAACPLHMAPQPMAEASVDTTACLDTCTRGTPAQSKARSDHGWRSDGRTGWLRPRYVPRRHAHLGTRLWSQRWSGLIWSNPSGVTAAADAICPRSLWKCFSGTALLCWKDSRQFSIDWACSTERRAVRLTESNSMPRKEILCTGESLLFPSWPEAPTGWGGWAPCPCVRTTALETGPVWASRRGSWEREYLLPLMGQGLPPRPWAEVALREPEELKRGMARGIQPPPQPPPTPPFDEEVSGVQHRDGHVSAMRTMTHPRALFQRAESPSTWHSDRDHQMKPGKRPHPETHEQEAIFKKTPVARGALLEFALFRKRKHSLEKCWSTQGRSRRVRSLKSCSTPSEKQQHWTATPADVP